ncbi:MAG: GNAT family N-acetyltransferase [Porphyromonadaceae bacterium]|nr:MAG: GNAT family N-acetyltransferase [Porphyromonadaceae bacterium]
MIVILKAEEKDIQVIADFQVAMASETEGIDLNPETVFRGVSSVFADPTKGFYLVAKEDGRTLGSLMITYEWSDWRVRTVWWIQSLYVIPENRRQGIFKQMYAWLLQKVNRDDSVGGIRLYVDHTNLKAQKVYESLGMDGNHYRFYEFMK